MQEKALWVLIILVPDWCIYEMQTCRVPGLYLGKVQGPANTQVCCLKAFWRGKREFKALYLMLSSFPQEVKLEKRQSMIQIFWMILSGPVENINVFSSSPLTWWVTGIPEQRSECLEDPPVKNFLEEENFLWEGKVLTFWGLGKIQIFGSVHWVYRGPTWDVSPWYYL